MKGEGEVGKKMENEEKVGKGDNGKEKQSQTHRRRLS